MSDLLCGECGNEDAICLTYFEKPVPDVGKITLYDPKILCACCNGKRQGNLYQEKARTIHFYQLATWPERRVCWLISMRGKESNCFATAFWSCKLWLIYYRYKFNKEKGGINV